MPADEALEAVRGYAAANRIRLTGHVLERMEERCVTYGDVREALMTATVCRPEPNDRWLVTGGRNQDEEPLALVVVLEDRVVVVTVF
ncbi:MAG: DUF4258 domain-containing protein [Deltaproteobacteria bacterium]|nr:DUF4258 domain-containing protein [Deltaproteobacteria bacterium]